MSYDALRALQVETDVPPHRPGGPARRASPYERPIQVFRSRDLIHWLETQTMGYARQGQFRRPNHFSPADNEQTHEGASAAQDQNLELAPAQAADALRGCPARTQSMTGRPPFSITRIAAAVPPQRTLGFFRQVRANLQLFEPPRIEPGTILKLTRKFGHPGNLWRLLVPGKNTPSRLPFAGEDGTMSVVSRLQS